MKHKHAEYTAKKSVVGGMQGTPGSQQQHKPTPLLTPKSLRRLAAAATQRLLRAAQPNSTAAGAALAAGRQRRSRPDCLLQCQLQYKGLLLPLQELARALAGVS
jgi:hypothetical protein